MVTGPFSPDSAKISILVENVQKEAKDIIPLGSHEYTPAEKQYQQQLRKGNTHTRGHKVWKYG